LTEYVIYRQSVDDSQPCDSDGTLTSREAEVVRLVSQGLSNKAVARQLGVQEGTVKIHLHNVFRKLGVSNRTRLILKKIEGEWPLALLIIGAMVTMAWTALLGYGIIHLVQIAI
jgi:DNA-binding NarL/FixJ family response regulator